MRTSRRASDALTSARISSKTLRRRSTIESAALFKDVVQAQAALDTAGWSACDLDKGTLECSAVRQAAHTHTRYCVSVAMAAASTLAAEPAC
eukprot:14892-Heterococcus_DN1.PRE.2